MTSHLPKAAFDHKPPLPYTIQSVLQLTPHSVPDKPPDRHVYWPTEKLFKELKTLNPLELCLRYPLSGCTGNDSPGNVLEMQITGTVSSQDGQTSQILIVRKKSSQGSASEVQGLGTSTYADVVAKVYDPLYWDFNEVCCDVFRTCDSLYQHEVAAYKQLESLGSAPVPQFHGAHTTRIPAGPQAAHRLVRLILMEQLHGSSLQELDPAKYSVKQRQAIMIAVIKADSKIRQSDVTHGDLFPRNVMLVTCDEVIADVRLIDFGNSTCGWLSDSGKVPKPQPGITVAEEPPPKIVKRWSYETFEEVIERFEGWTHGWDWDAWLEQALEVG